MSVADRGLIGYDLSYSTALTDYYYSVSATISRDTVTMTNPSLKIHLTSGNQAGFVSTGHEIYGYGNAISTAIKARIRISGTPAGNFIFFDFYRNGAAGVWIDTSRKLNVGVSASHLSTSTNTITAATEYILEAIYNSAEGSFGTFKAKLYDNTGALIEEVKYTLVSGDSAPGYAPYVGMNNIKSASNPAIDIWMGEIVQRWIEGTSTTIDYIGMAAYPQAGSYPTAEGTSTDWIALSGTKISNIDETPSDGDTSYIYKWMDGAPTASPSVAVGAAGVLNSTYKYKVTNVTAVGESSDGGLTSAAVTPANQQVNLTNIQTSPSPNVTARNIYRNKAGGTTYFLLTTINDNTTTSYTDNTADGSLGSATAPANGAASVESFEDFIFSGSGLTSPTTTKVPLGNLSNWVNYAAISYGYSNNPADDSALTNLAQISFGFNAWVPAAGLDVTFKYSVTQLFYVKVTSNSDGSGTVLGYCFFANWKAGISTGTSPARLLIRISSGSSSSTGGPAVFLSPNSFMGPL